MRREEEFVGRKAQFAEMLRKVADELEADSLMIRGQLVTLPECEMEYKLSQKSDLGAVKLSIAIEWMENA